MKGTLPLSFALGFITASPIGPIGLLCLRRTLSRSVLPALSSALGISFAYAFWSFVTIHGLSAISSWIDEHKLILQLVIGLFFLLYGLHGIFMPSITGYRFAKRKNGFAEFLSTFTVVLFNPATFIMFSALFALFGIAQIHFGLFESFEIASAVFGGSMTFWIAVTQVIQKTRRYINDSIFTSVTHLSAHAILLFGLAILCYCLQIWLRSKVEFQG